MAVWRKINGWQYETFERDVEPEALSGFEDLVRLWQEKRGDRTVPTLADFDFYDFKGWHGRIVLTDLMYDPFDIRYRLIGAQVAERVRNDYTGKLYSELAAQGVNSLADFEFYEMTSREMLISRVSGDLHWVRQKHVSATFIEFPLSDTGEMATHSLSAMI